MAKITGNEGPKGEKLENGAGPGAVKFIMQKCKFHKVFDNLWGGAHELATTKPKRKEMKAQKAKMKGNEGPKGQNGRK